jgi:acetyltransferase (GNAT) family protein
MHPLTYLHLQMQLEGKALVGDRLGREAGAAPDGQLPLLLLARLTTGELVAYYNESLPADLHKKLAATLHDIRFPQLDQVRDVLRAHNIRTEAGHYVTYLFPAEPADAIDGDVVRCSKGDPRLRALGMDGTAEHIFGIEQDGRIVSACASARENEHCGEAWVFTLPEYRGRRLGGRAASAWAQSLTAARKIPFYSYELEDAPSAGLAGHLGLQPIFEEIAILPASA